MLVVMLVWRWDGGWEFADGGLDSRGLGFSRIALFLVLLG